MVVLSEGGNQVGLESGRGEIRGDVAGDATSRDRDGTRVRFVWQWRCGASALDVDVRSANDNNIGLVGYDVAAPLYLALSREVADVGGDR